MSKSKVTDVEVSAFSECFLVLFFFCVFFLTLGHTLLVFHAIVTTGSSLQRVDIKLGIFTVHFLKTVYDMSFPADPNLKMGRL